MAIARSKILWLVPAIVLFLAACNPCSRKDHTPRLTEAEVVSIADALAREEGYDLRKWQRPRVHYEFADPDCTWSVSYNMINATIMPSDFLVLVNDNTKHAYLSGGM